MTQHSNSPATATMLSLPLLLSPPIGTGTAITVALFREGAALFGGEGGGRSAGGGGRGGDGGAATVGDGGGRSSVGDGDSGGEPVVAADGGGEAIAWGGGRVGGGAPTAAGCGGDDTTATGCGGPGAGGGGSGGGTGGPGGDGRIITATPAGCRAPADDGGSADATAAANVLDCKYVERLAAVAAAAALSGTIRSSRMDAVACGGVALCSVALAPTLSASATALAGDSAAVCRAAAAAGTLAVLWPLKPAMVTGNSKAAEALSDEPPLLCWSMERPSSRLLRCALPPAKAPPTIGTGSPTITREGSTPMSCATPVCRR